MIVTFCNYRIHVDPKNNLIYKKNKRPIEIPSQPSNVTCLRCLVIFCPINEFLPRQNYVPDHIIPHSKEKQK